MEKRLTGILLPFDAVIFLAHVLLQYITGWIRKKPAVFLQFLEADPMLVQIPVSEFTLHSVVKQHESPA